MDLTEEKLQSVDVEGAERAIPRIGDWGVKVLAKTTKKTPRSICLELQLNAHSNRPYDCIYTYYIACIHVYP